MTTVTLTVDRETERIARQISMVAHQSIDIVVRDALAERAARLGITVNAQRRRKTPAEVEAAFERALERLCALPILDPRSSDDILGYDEHGLPR